MSDRHYLVKYPSPALGLTYGVAESYSDEAKACAAKGQVLIAHAIYPGHDVVPEKDVIDLPHEFMKGTYDGELHMYVGGDEHRNYISIMQALHDVYESRLTRDKLCVGHQFHLGVGDGYANYVVTKVARTNCQVEWRGFCLDRWHDRLFGWGGSFRRRDVEPLVGIGRKSLGSLFGHDKITKAIEKRLPELVKGFKKEWGQIPQDMSHYVDILKAA